MRKCLTAILVPAAFFMPAAVASATEDAPPPEVQATLDEALANGVDEGVASLPDVPSATYGALSNKTSKYYRGSYLMLTRDIVSWTYTPTRVTGAKSAQAHGFVFPNISENLGYGNWYVGTGYRKIRYTNAIGAGVVTPWGDVKVYKYTVEHLVQINSRGIAQWSRM